MLIAQYGNTSQISNDSDLMNTPMSLGVKNNLSSFDLILGELDSFQSKDNSIDLEKKNTSTSLSENRSAEYKDFSEISNKKSDGKSETEVSNKMQNKEPEKIKFSDNKEKSINSVDLKYLSDLNKKMNELLEKAKKLNGTESGVDSQISMDLKTLMTQIQQFMSSKNLDVTNAVSGKVNTQNTMLNQLLKGMSGKLEQIKSLMSQFNLGNIAKTKKDLEVAPGQLDVNLGDMKKLDHELDKTMKLFKDLKNISQQTKDYLNNDNSALKAASQKINHVQWQINHQQINATYNTHIPVGKSESSMPVVSSGQNFSGQSHPDGAGNSQGHSSFAMGEGINRFPSLTSSSGTFDLKDVAQMSTQDKMMLGKEILTQIQDSMKGFIGKNQSKFSISLKPEELGDVKIIMNMEGKTIKSHIIVENEVVKEVLKNRFDDMKNVFQAQGIDVSEFSVQTQAEFNENSNGNKDNIMAMNDTYKYSAQQVKLNRALEDNFDKTYFVYEKGVDNLNETKEFVITV